MVVFANILLPCNAQLTAAFSSLAKSTLDRKTVLPPIQMEALFPFRWPTSFVISFGGDFEATF